VSEVVRIGLGVEGTSLKDLIQVKSYQKEKFTVDDLWAIAEKMITALSLLQQAGLSHGDINNSTVFHHEGEYKILAISKLLSGLGSKESTESMGSMGIRNSSEANHKDTNDVGVIVV